MSCKNEVVKHKGYESIAEYDGDEKIYHGALHLGSDVITFQGESETIDYRTWPRSVEMTADEVLSDLVSGV